MTTDDTMVLYERQEQLININANSFITIDFVFKQYNGYRMTSCIPYLWSAQVECSICQITPDYIKLGAKNNTNKYEDNISLGIFISYVRSYA